MDITTPELSVTVGEDNVRYTAVFAKRELNVSFTVQPNGITAAPEVALKEPAEEQVGFFCKDEITVTLEEKINNACYKFVGFYNNAEEKIAEPNAVAGTLSYDFTLEGDTAVIALYEPIQNTVTHTVTAANLGELNLVKVDGETPTAEQIDA